MIYKVFWYLVQVQWGLCPLPPKLNASGMDTAAYTPITAIQNCWRLDSIPYSKEFKTLAEAQKFKQTEEAARIREKAARVPGYGDYYSAAGNATGYKIDSIKVK